ncbi:hypothetical protein HYW87_03710 [Candidatus Roizmanbacteria bacterium]|nr:hypothetical protein [Candidatus Roizmanbacteria bacterium]
MKITTFEEAEKYLYTHIPRGMKQKFPGDVGLERTKYFLKHLGDPQNKIKVIHVAGTSGKGSTAYLTSLLLKSLGFKVGFHVSPFVVDIRERCQINNQFIAKAEFSNYLNQLVPSIEKVKQSKWGDPTYFEIVTVLAFYIFSKRRVDYAVIETGLGGWYDATNCVTSENKIALITRIGRDHTNILGRTLDKIALQKAMITQEKNTVISFWQDYRARKVIERVVREKKAKLFYVKRNDNFNNIKVSLEGISFNFEFLDNKIINIQLKLIGSYQAENCSLALVVVVYLSKRDRFPFDEKKIRKTLQEAHFAARFEVVKIKEKQIIIDGAHNPQKMQAFSSNLQSLFPNKKFHFLIAFKVGKDYKAMLKYIIPLASKITVTSFFYDREDLIHLSQDPKEVGESLKKLGFRNIKVIQDPKKALRNVLRSKNYNIVITGSLYLIGVLYKDLKKS